MDITYSRNLIKGKITELIFQKMFQSSREFIIISLGYEHTLPTLAQYQHYIEVPKILDNIRHAPDFVLLSQDKKETFLVEVKYRSEIDTEEIYGIAEELSKQYNPSWLFVASHNGFYFDSCHLIINKNGTINELNESWISKSRQEEYRKLLNEFIH